LSPDKPHKLLDKWASGTADFFAGKKRGSTAASDINVLEERNSALLRSFLLVPHPFLSSDPRKPSK